MHVLLENQCHLIFENTRREWCDWSNDLGPPRESRVDEDLLKMICDCISTARQELLSATDEVDGTPRISPGMATATSLRPSHGELGFATFGGSESRASYLGRNSPFASSNEVNGVIILIYFFCVFSLLVTVNCHTPSRPSTCPPPTQVNANRRLGSRTEPPE